MHSDYLSNIKAVTIHVHVWEEVASVCKMLERVVVPSCVENFVVVMVSRRAVLARKKLDDFNQLKPKLFFLRPLLEICEGVHRT